MISELNLNLKNIIFRKLMTIHSHTMEYYTAIKRKEVLIQTPTQTNYKGIELTERSHSQEVTCYKIPFP